MFERLKDSLRDALSRASTPEGRAALSQMREALVHAKLGISDLRVSVEHTRAKLVKERSELETVRRRARLAAGINDAETVRVAEQYERRHAEHVQVMERKLAAQEAELELAEREYAEMMAQLKGVPVGSREVPSDADPMDPAVGGQGSTGARDFDRAAREAAAQRQLEELKRRMGK